jgi:hypothetical protein
MVWKPVVSRLVACDVERPWPVVLANEMLAYMDLMVAWASGGAPVRLLMRA